MSTSSYNLFMPHPTNGSSHSVGWNWRSPSAAERSAWNRAVGTVWSSGQPYPSVACPACGAPLRYFFVRYRPPDRGSFWVWCPVCLRYEHSTARVPTWWQERRPVDLSLLYHCPDWLEDHWDEVRPAGWPSAEP